MKLPGHTHSIQRGSITGEKQFGIALTAKMYSMVTDRLYTDRIGSVVREVCSNAWDGEKMLSVKTGQPQKPFLVKLPTDLEPHFIVEDQGVGMPDEQAQELYSTLGLSTKEDCNDQIGAFGLGSKSPFAVTDTFTVENTYDGVTHYYLCFKSEEGLPSLLKTGEKKEDGRPNGVKVIIPAPGSKYRDYRQALVRQLIFMEPKPIIGNLEQTDFKDPEFMLKNEYGFILSNCIDFGLRTQSVYARMGMVVYPIDMEQLGLYQGYHRSLGHSSCLVLEFPIGALQPLPSREGLTYDSTTINNLKSGYNKFGVDYRKRLADSVSEQATPLEAWRQIKNIQRNCAVNLMGDGLYVLGTPINDERIPNSFPTFPHIVQRERTIWVKDENGVIKREEDGSPLINKELFSEEVKLSKFVHEEYTRNDTRLNIKRDTVDTNRVNFTWLDQVDRGEIRFLLLDEIEPKYRITRLKDVLNTLNYRQTYYFVRVNPLSQDNKTDFTEFYESLERLHPGITKSASITKLSEVPKPVIAKAKRDPEDTKPIPGVKTYGLEYAFEKDITWERLDELINPEEPDENEPKFQDTAFYVTANRSDLDKYPKVTLDKLKEFIKVGNYALFIVRKTGASQIKRLEAAGIREFKTFFGDKMKAANLSDDFKMRNSAKEIYRSSKIWFSHGNLQQYTKLINQLESNGEFIHPFMSLCKEIVRLRNGHMSSADDLIIERLRDSGLYLYLGESDWVQKLCEINLWERFNQAEKDFIAFYPAFETLMDRMPAYVGDGAVCKIRYQYLVDYNFMRGETPQLNAMVATTEQENEFESQEKEEPETKTELEINFDADEE